MKTKILLSTLGSSALALGLVAAGTSHASLIDCNTLDPDISGRVTTNMGCQVLEPLDGEANDNVGGDPSTWIVNTEAWFGISDWLYDGRWEDPDAEGLNPLFFDPADDTLNLVTVEGHAQGGTWSLDPTFVYGDLLFLFKDGGDTNLVGYLMTGYSGSYETPFISPPFDAPGDGSRDISHISIYYRPGDNDIPPEEIPAPAPLALLGLGLGLMGLMTLRRRRPQ